MLIHFREELFAALKKAGAKSAPFKQEDRWGRSIDSRLILAEDFDVIRKALDRKNIEDRRVGAKIDMVEAVKADVGKVVKRLEAFAEIVQTLVAKTRRKWMFVDDESLGASFPCLVESVKYHPPESRGESYIAAYVSIKMKASRRGGSKDKSLTLDQSELGKPAVDVLKDRGCFLETDDLVAAYEADMAKYRKHRPETGEQFLGSGSAISAQDHWRRDTISLEKDGERAKLVMDDGVEFGKEDNTHGVADDVEDDSDDEREREAVPLPIHPVLRMFNLGTHEYVDLHVQSIEPYVYDAAIASKLILPDDHKELVDTLVGSAVRRMEDIVRGKATGVIVLASGTPGTGKTLTAEVYSEIAKRPLYAVQCSQLGTSEEELEKRLSEVLERATRWRAILLIDEADVYIHERGNDINQNAIVGVFLRLLEYYKGILFMTTNREQVVDDAILSRLTAHLRYEIPEGEDRHRIWEVLLRQYDAKVSPRSAVEAFPKISGRSIRQIVRLGKIMAEKRGTPITVEMMKWAAKFHDFSGEEKS